MKQILSTFKHLSKKAVFLISALLVAGLGIFIYSYFFSKEAGAAWFNESWLYRTPLTITHNAEVPHNKVKFDIDTATLITAGKMQADCGDSRFTDANGNLLKYYLDSANGACNDASTDYYVLIPKVLNGTTVTYHYYGNPSAPNGSEPAQFSESTLTPSGSYAAGSEAQGPGPVGYWKFDDGQGTNTQDSSSSGNDGTITGATWQTEDRCVSGKCLYFDGTDDIVSVTDNPALDMGTHDFTISAWIRHTPTLTASWDSAIVEKITATDGYRFTIRETEAGSSAGKLLLSLRTSSADTEITSNTALNDGKWHHVVAAADRDGNVTFYVDGKSDGGGSIAARSASLDNTGDLRIGLTNAYFKGNMDEIKIYPYLRSAAQIKTDYLAGKANASTHSGTSAVLGSQAQDWLSNGLVGYWKMDDAGIDAEGESSTDSSGNSNTGTLYGDNGVGDNGTGMNCTASGKFGSGCNFDGVDDYISLDPSTAFDVGSTGDFSASLWVKSSATNDNHLLRAQSDNDNYWSLYHEGSDDLMRFRIQNGSGNSDVLAATTTVENGNWHFVTIVRKNSGTRMEIYIDGALNNSSTSTARSPGTISQFRIAEGAGNYLAGTVDEIRVYNRALSSAEISSLYNWAPGPVGYWDFEDGNGGTVTDRSGNANNGTWAGTGATHWTTGKYGKAGKFNGSDDYVGTSYTHNYTSGITLSGWFRTSTTGSANYALFGDSFGSTVAGTGIYYQGSGTNLQFDGNTASGTNWNISCTTTGLNDNKWHYVAATWDGTTTANKVVCYIDGVQKNTGTATSTITTATGVTNIGRNRNDNNLFFPGSIDDVRIYNYARTQKQIVSDMNAGHPNVGSPVGSAIGHWKFDEGQGTVANNSGSGGSTLNGTLTSMASPATATSGWTQSGKFGKALNFDGSNDLVTLSDPGSGALDPTNISVSAWVYRAATSSRYERVAEKWGDDTGQASYMLRIQNNGKAAFYGSTDGLWANEVKATSNTTIGAASWYHLVGVYDGTNVRIYVNGILEASTALTGNLYNGTSAFRISSSYTDEAFNGTIDEVKVYPYALTADEVKLDYNKGSSLVLGTAGNNSSYAAGAANQEYCVPGDSPSTSCAAPVGRWDFEEKKGTSANDTSGNANTGTLGGDGSGTDLPTWKSGKAGGALSFDGSDDYVDMGNASSLQITGAITLEAWVKNTSGLSTADVVSKFSSKGYSLTYTGATGLECLIYGATEAYILAGPNIKDEKWHHLACVYDTSTIVAYVDGVRYTTGVSGVVPAAITDAAVSATIGKNTTGNGFFNGQIDQVRIFNYARSAAQIAWDYNKGAPVGHWKFDECQGATAYDSSGNKNNGTITIGATDEATLGTCSTSSTAWGSGATGKRNASLSFDGDDDYISVADPGASSVLDMNGQITMSAWIKTSSTNNYSGIIHKSDNVSKGYQITLGVNGNVRGDFYNGTGYGTVQTTGVNVIDGSWHLITTTYDGTTAKIYIDGVQKKSTELSGHLAANSNDNSALLIGSDDAEASRYFNGQIDDVRVFNYALTATQVKDIMNQGAVFFGPSTGSP